VRPGKSAGVPSMKAWASSDRRRLWPRAQARNTVNAWSMSRPRRPASLPLACSPRPPAPPPGRLPGDQAPGQGWAVGCRRPGWEDPRRPSPRPRASKSAGRLRPVPERPPHPPLLLAMTAASLHAHRPGQPTATRPVMRHLPPGELHRFPAVLHYPPVHEPARRAPGTARHRWPPDPGWRILAAARSHR
jgi:hypothetical protein